MAEAYEPELVIGEHLASTRAAIYWLGRMARGIDYCLNLSSQPDENTPAWDALDAEGRDLFAVDLHYVLDLNNSIGMYSVGQPWRAQVLPGHVESKLRDRVDRYEGSLPFSRSEAIWLGSYIEWEEEELVLGESHAPLTPRISALRAMSRRFTAPGGGSRGWQSSGAELTDRWWDWRRGVGQFAVTSSYERSREALQELHSLMGGAWTDRDWEETTGEA